MSGERVAASRFWHQLWDVYPAAPSIALCRVPELEYASALPLAGKTLDHCCGDGLFAAMAWPGATFTAGCDLSAASITSARARGRHERLDVCDAGAHLPYEDEMFDLVFDNSALEHIQDLDQAVHEVARVTRRGGRFALNVLNRRYFDWWPLRARTAAEYREAQPFHHALTLAEWKAVFRRHGFELSSVQGYFDRSASRYLAYLDCKFSLTYLRDRRSFSVLAYHRLKALRPLLKRRLGSLRWKTGADEGAGYFIVAEKH